MSVLKTYGAQAGFKTSQTYELKGNRLERKIDSLEAVKQSVTLMLITDRFAHIIYSWDYGNELQRFIGKDRAYTKGDIERRIRESLFEDDRVEGISEFSLNFERESALISFKVDCIFGTFEVERSVVIVK